MDLNLPINPCYKERHVESTRPGELLILRIRSLLDI